MLFISYSHSISLCSFNNISKTYFTYCRKPNRNYIGRDMILTYLLHRSLETLNLTFKNACNPLKILFHSQPEGRVSEIVYTTVSNLLRTFLSQKLFNFLIFILLARPYTYWFFIYRQYIII